MVRGWFVESPTNAALWILYPTVSGHYWFVDPGSNETALDQRVLSVGAAVGFLSRDVFLFRV